MDCHEISIAITSFLAGMAVCFIAVVFGTKDKLHFKTTYCEDGIPTCPKCNSKEYILRAFNGRKQVGWQCSRCEHSWQDSEFNIR